MGIVSDPVVSYRETVNETSHMTCLAKSPNKHNRIYLTAEPMSDELCAAIEDGKAGPKAEAKERAKFLREKFEWDEMRRGRFGAGDLKLRVLILWLIRRRQFS